MSRLFTAIKVPDAIAHELSLKQFGIEGARWIDKHDFHITLRFMGNIDTHITETLHTQFSHIHVPKFSIQLSGMGSFGKKKPRSLWVGVSESTELIALNLKIENLCRNCGLEAEMRNYLPHLTIARLKGVKPSYVEYYKENQNLYKSEVFDVDSFCLLSSKLSTGGGPYATLETYKLGT